MWELQGHLKFSAGEERRGRKEWTMPLLKVARLNLVFSSEKTSVLLFQDNVSSVCTVLCLH